MSRKRKPKSNIDANMIYLGSPREEAEIDELAESDELETLAAADVSSEDDAPGLFQETADIDDSKVLPQLLPDYIVDDEQQDDFETAEPADAFLEIVQGGRDDRRRVSGSDLHLNPFNAICHLRFVTKSGGAFVGTGWLIAPRTVITAGHCVFCKPHGGWVRSMTISTQRNGGPSTARESQTVTRGFKTTEVYTRLRHGDPREPEYDYGAIILPRAFQRAGHFGYAVYAPDKLRNETFNVVGYPGEKSGTMWGHFQRGLSVSSRLLTYQIDTTKGQSGAPLFDIVPGPNGSGKRYVSVGIHNAGNDRENFATRVNRDVFTLLDKWRGMGQ